MESSSKKGYYNTRSKSFNASFIQSKVFAEICEKFREQLGDKPVDVGQFEWTPLAEILFFHAMMDNKPAGVNRHFNMLAIHSKFSTFIGREISSEVIWEHLRSLYDMDVLNATETMPFPNEETEFELPSECHELLEKKYGVTLRKDGKEKEISETWARSDCYVKMDQLNIDISKVTHSFHEILLTRQTGSKKCPVAKEKANECDGVKPRSPKMKENVEKMPVATIRGRQ